MSLQASYAPGALLKSPKETPTSSPAEDYPDDDPGFLDSSFSLDGSAGGWPGGDAFPPDALDEFPPDGEAKIDRSSGPKAVPAKDKAVPVVKGGKKGR